MAKRLEGNECRVFRCLIKEHQFEGFEQLCIEQTRVPALSPEEVAEALASLQESGYAEFKPGHWKRTPTGYGVGRTLLGELLPDDDTATVA
jgi:hypothetical protein